ncbi:MAG: hypothetical protein AB7F31_06940 [Parachlamydiales bacterium]
MHRFTFYGQKPGVLFQFLLDQFLSAFGEVKAIQKLCNHLSTATDWQVSHMMAALGRLTGHPLSDPTPSWESDRGHLGNLKHLATTFSELSDYGEARELAGAVDRAFFSALEARDTLPRFLRSPLQKERLQVTVLCTPHLRRLVENVERIGNLIPSLIAHFREEENVLLFLLRRRPDFDSLYGTSFTKNLLQMMFPEGLRELQVVMEERYRKRGFEKLAESVRHRLADIQLTSP